MEMVGHLFMGYSNLEIGRKGEELAVRYLKKLGYSIIEKNYRCPMGEVDIIAREGDILVFIEVKTRKDISFGRPKEAIDYRKRWQISKVAQYFLKKKNLQNISARFDVLEVQMDALGLRFELIKDAFELPHNRGDGY
jgi:putative endonuclease